MTPHLLNSTQSEEKEDSIVIRTVSQLPLFLSLLVVVALSGLHPPLMCQNYLIDRGRRAMDVSRSLCDFILSAGCITSLPQRVASITRILTGCLPFISGSSEVEVVAEGIRSRLLLYRLKSNTHTGWESLDFALYESYDGPSTLLSADPGVVTVLDLLLRHQLNETLQVQP